MRAEVTVPGLRVCSELNARGHWSARYRRCKRQSSDVWAVLMFGVSRAAAMRLAGAPRVRVTLTRLVGPRGRLYDDDNLAGALKACRDTVSQFIGRDDGPKSGVSWVVRQERAADYGVRICLEEVWP